MEAASQIEEFMNEKLLDENENKLTISSRFISI